MLTSFLEKKGFVALWLELWLSLQDSFVVCGTSILVGDIGTLFEVKQHCDNVSNSKWTRRKIQHKAAKIPVKLLPLELVLKLACGLDEQALFPS